MEKIAFLRVVKIRNVRFISSFSSLLNTKLLKPDISTPEAITAAWVLFCPVQDLTLGPGHIEPGWFNCIFRRPRFYCICIFIRPRFYCICILNIKQHLTCSPVHSQWGSRRSAAFVSQQAWVLKKAWARNHKMFLSGTISIKLFTFYKKPFYLSWVRSGPRPVRTGSPPSGVKPRWRSEGAIWK